MPSRVNNRHLLDAFKQLCCLMYRLLTFKNQNLVHTSIINDSWKTSVLNALMNMQNHPSIGVLLKRCSENMQQIYRRTRMRKCGFNKISIKASDLGLIVFGSWVKINDKVLKLNTIRIYQ